MNFTIQDLLDDFIKMSKTNELAIINIIMLSINFAFIVLIFYVSTLIKKRNKKLSSDIDKLTTPFIVVLIYWYFDMLNIILFNSWPVEIKVIVYNIGGLLMAIFILYGPIFMVMYEIHSYTKIIYLSDNTSIRINDENIVLKIINKTYKVNYLHKKNNIYKTYKEITFKEKDIVKIINYKIKP